MLTAHEVARLCERLGLSAEARAVVETIRSSPPARRVRSAAVNVSVRYPSRKMGVTIQAESHHVELAALYEYEHDPRTLEFYDQPPPIKLVYEAKNGRQLGVWHTPDYFVIRDDEAVWEEWKTEAGLEQLAQTMPNRYVRDETGRWRCPPGERFAKQFGLYYRLRSSADIDWVLQRNLRFLQDYLALDAATVDKQSADAILKLVEQAPGLHLDVLVGQLNDLGVDNVYSLIANNGIYVDLHVAPLAEPERVCVFRDAQIARAFEVVGMQEPPNSRLSAEAHGRLARASPADLREANRRYAILAPYLTGMVVLHLATPREAFAAGLQLAGQRPQRRIAYDEDFRMLTLPTTVKGTAKLQPGHGVRLHYLYYWSDAFVDPEAEGTQVPVRYDPFDAGIAYAFVKKRWVRCISEHHARFAGRSEREIQLASTELRRQQQRHGQRMRITARQLADFLVSLEAEEVVLEQRLRDAEAKSTLEPLVANPPFDSNVVAALKAADSEATVELEEVITAAIDGTSDEALVIYADY
jgi:Mu transposase-like protein